jgi:hypothetical protein
MHVCQYDTYKRPCMTCSSLARLSYYSVALLLRPGNETKATSADSSTSGVGLCASTSRRNVLAFAELSICFEPRDEPTFASMSRDHKYVLRGDTTQM